MVINLFCDASINTDKKVACGGCLAVVQNDVNSRINDNYNVISKKLIIQNNATNNSSEILAIWAGVNEALRLRATMYPNAIFRLFSDSKISLYGLRDWIKNWIANSNGGVLISSSGQPVMNQQRFIEIFNLIVENDLHIELYHQRGHVMDGRISLDKARTQFIKANKVPPERLGNGIDINYLSFYNNLIDGMTRESVNLYLNSGALMEGVEVEGINPFEYIIRSNMLQKYIKCINKTSIFSRHDFKGGYNQ